MRDSCSNVPFTSAKVWTLGIPDLTTRNKAIVKELANRSAYKIQYVIVNLVFKV
jgi:hypothetical protein